MATASSRGRGLRYVIQKHDASRLHFDVRLELDGIMKSWAVPKGPSLDPAMKRLAVEVDDHPPSYNEFEGTIPEGRYGGGTVMLWDRGTYRALDGGEEAVRAGYEAGKLDVELQGERLRGGFSFVRTRGRGGKPQWLMMKRRDEHARTGVEVAEEDSSIATGRTMAEIASGARVRRAPGNVAKATERAPAAASRKRTPLSALKAESLEPMYASIGTAVPAGDAWAFEPKYDGVRVLAHVNGRSVRLVTRNLKDKASQFPEVVRALRDLGARVGEPMILDGEIVAMAGGGPARFQALQGRMHLKGADDVARASEEVPSALVAFDVLRVGGDVLVDLPWTERRARLERLLGSGGRACVVLGRSERGDGERMLAWARENGWEGIIAKRADAAYESGRRSPSWLKLKVEFRQELVIGGYTEPRNSREHIGALLLGYYDGDRFVYAGHTGGGFTRQGLADMAKRLRPLERRTSPFVETLRTNEPAHWVRPEVVVEVKFSEWTADGRLRQPIFLGVRDDKEARDVTRERTSVQRTSVQRAGGRGAAKKGAGTTTKAASTPRRTRSTQHVPTQAALDKLADQITRLERAGGDGTLELPGGAALHVTSLDKDFFPKDGITKGDLMRYYVRMARTILPLMADRPLVLKRYPNGIGGSFFYQQTAPESPPEGVRAEMVRDTSGKEQPRLVGGDLATLLYTVQLGTIVVDVWNTRATSLDTADYAVLDLDPGDRAPYTRVVEVARWVKEELDAAGLVGVPKTSGATGLHIFVPLPKGTSPDTAALLAELIATRVARAHPKEATVERMLKKRTPQQVYVDHMQNNVGKTVAAAYSVRARPGATVSTPLRWSEVVPSLDPTKFTLKNTPARLKRLGDIWGEALKKGNTRRAIEKAGDSGE